MIKKKSWIVIYGINRKEHQTSNQSVWINCWLFKLSLFLGSFWKKRVLKIRIDDEINRLTKKIKELEDRFDTFNDSIDDFASNSDLQETKDDLGNLDNRFDVELRAVKKIFKRSHKKIARVMPWSEYIKIIVESILIAKKLRITLAFA